MYKILTLNNISVKGLERLPRDRYEVASEIQRPHAVLVRSYNMHEIEIPESVLAIGRAGAGVNNIPVDKMSRRGVVVFNAPGANANAVKELVLTGMLLACRNIVPALGFVRGLQGDDETIHKQVEAGKKQFVGFELPGRTMGVIGLGAIGVEVANAARQLGMKVIGFDPDITVQRAWQLSAEVEKASSIEDLLARVEFVSLHVPLNEQTHHMINEERLQVMKEGVVLLNFARDGVVDDVAVCAAIESGKVYTYACDFPNNRLKDHPRVITLPHLGASTREAEENCAVMVAEQVRDYLENGNIRNSVNYPAIQLPRSRGNRLVIANANVPDMVAQISHALGRSKLNIIHLVNDSRGDYAYTMMDVEPTIPAQTIEAIGQIEGVLNVRTL
jgi:D-3-phosphoglycerate dehydrogenase